MHNKQANMQLVSLVILSRHPLWSICMEIDKETNRERILRQDCMTWKLSQLIWCGYHKCEMMTVSVYLRRDNIVNGNSINNTAHSEYQRTNKHWSEFSRKGGYIWKILTTIFKQFYFYFILTEFLFWVFGLLDAGSVASVSAKYSLFLN